MSGLHCRVSGTLGSLAPSNVSRTRPKHSPGTLFRCAKIIEPKVFGDPKLRVMEAWKAAPEPAPLPSSAPFVAQALRDPVLGVAAHAAMALGSCGDAHCLAALRRYTARLLSTAAADRLPASIGLADPLLAQAARSRLLLGDAAAEQDLVGLLLSDDLATRRMAIGTLEHKHGDTKGFRAEDTARQRRRAAARWQR